jgi:hypothetical protein
MFSKNTKKIIDNWNEPTWKCEIPKQQKWDLTNLPGKIRVVKDNDVWNNNETIIDLQKCIFSSNEIYLGLMAGILEPVEESAVEEFIRKFREVYFMEFTTIKNVENWLHENLKGLFSESELKTIKQSLFYSRHRIKEHGKIQAGNLEKIEKLLNKLKN